LIKSLEDIAYEAFLKAINRKKSADANGHQQSLQPMSKEESLARLNRVDKSSILSFDITGADEFFTSISESPGNFYYNIELLMSNDFADFAWAQIANLGFIGQVVELKNRLGSNMREKIWQIYNTFESICTDKAAVRSHCYRCGPDSYLFWLKSHLDFYSFNSDAARNLKSKIEKVVLSEKMSVNDIRNGLKELRGYFSGDFQNLFQGDFLIACLGLVNGKVRRGEITAAHVDAFFLYSFYGEPVPVGFKAYLGVSMPTMPPPLPAPPQSERSIRMTEEDYRKAREWLKAHNYVLPKK
jgi:hypothetical protein